MITKAYARKGKALDYVRVSILVVFAFILSSYIALTIFLNYGTVAGTALYDSIWMSIRIVASTLMVVALCTTSFQLFIIIRWFHSLPNENKNRRILRTERMTYYMLAVNGGVTVMLFAALLRIAYHSSILLDWGTSSLDFVFLSPLTCSFLFCRTSSETNDGYLLSADPGELPHEGTLLERLLSLEAIPWVVL